MIKVRRLAYFVYYIRQLDWMLLDKFMRYLRTKAGWSRPRQWFCLFRDSIRFNISILEYYQFRFFELSDVQKAEWAGTGTMYEFHRHANPPAPEAWRPARLWPRHDRACCGCCRVA